MTKYFKNEFAINGDKVDIPNDIQASGEVSYQTGFGIDYQRKLGVDILAKPFPRQGFNGLIADLTGAIKQYQEQGFFNFITPEMNDGKGFAYAMGACVRYDLSEAQDGSDIRNFSSLINNNTGNPKDNPTDWQEVGKSQTSLGYSFTSVNTDITLTIDQSGVVLIDASAADVTVTLPVLDTSTIFILRRVDNTANKVKIKAGGVDKIKFNLAINPNGYSFFHLFGAGDYWSITNDGAGNWYDMERADRTPIGQVSYNTSIIAPTGGSLIANGAELSRADYPYLWDYAQKSGMLVDDTARAGFEGCFSKGDGATTFRLPDLRGEFLRTLDIERGVDVSRLIGSSQGDAIRNITGLVGFVGNGFTTYADGAFSFYGNSNGTIPQSVTGTKAYPRAFFDASKIVPTAIENRPKNIALPLYLKVI